MSFWGASQDRDRLIAPAPTGGESSVLMAPASGIPSQGVILGKRHLRVHPRASDNVYIGPERWRPRRLNPDGTQIITRLFCTQLRQEQPQLRALPDENQGRVAN